MSDFCVPDERDLRFASTSSNFNPRNIQYIPVVEIIAFLELEHKLPFFKGLRLITHICSTCERLPDTVRNFIVPNGREWVKKVKFFLKIPIAELKASRLCVHLFSRASLK